VSTDQTVQGAQQPPWLLLVRREPGGPSHGAGFYLGHRLAVTCAHVAVQAGRDVAPTAPDGAQVWISFEYLGVPAALPAAIVAWDAAKDIAIVEIAGEVPAGAAAPPLISLSGPVIGDAVTVLGYPDEHEDEAVPVEGHIDGVSGAGRISLVAGSQGLEFESGFSGAPVWDHQAHGVVGMVGWREGPRREGIAETRKGYAISAAAIVALCPAPAPPMTDPLAYWRKAELGRCTELPLASDGSLPLVSQVDIYDEFSVGVVRSLYDPGEDHYIPRDKVDDALEQGLAATGFVIASGPSLSGKSRALMELLRRTKGQARLVVPQRRPDALGRIADALRDTRDDVVVWLKNFDGLLDVLDSTLLLRLVRERGWTVAATTTQTPWSAAPGGITSREFERLWRSLERGKSIVAVPSRATAGELRRAAELYPQEEFDEVRGIGAQLASAGMLEERFRVGMEETQPGWAVVQAAIDWRRMGMTRPITRQQLRILSGLMLAEIDSDTDDAFADGLDWATAALAGRPPLLTAGAGGYRVFSRLVDQASQEDSPTARPVPDAAWSCLLADDMALDGEGLVVLTIAATALSRESVAQDAASRARGLVPAGPLHAWATLFLGWLSDMTGNAEEAYGLMLEAAASETPEVVGWARLEAGGLGLGLGHAEEGERLLRAAVTDEEASVAALAKATLGAYLLDQGDTEEARELLESVLMDLDDAEAVSMASRRYVELHSPSGPTGALEKGDESQLPAVHRRPGIEEMRKALNTKGGIRAQLLASLKLGGLDVSHRRNPDRARLLLERALESDDPLIRLNAQFSLGQLLVGLGERAAGKSHFQEVRELAGPRLAAEAAIELARLAYAEGDATAAIEALEAVRDAGDGHVAPQAAQVLGDVLCAEGQLEAGREAYRWAITSEHPTWSGAATIRLAISLCQGSVSERSRGLAMLRELAASDRGHSAWAAAALGELLAWLGDRDGALTAHEVAVHSGHPYWSQLARIDIAAMISAEDPHRAESLLAEAESADDAELSVRAHVLHMTILADLGGDVKEEIERHQQATRDLATSPLLTFHVTYWNLVTAVQSQNLDDAAAYAVTLRQNARTLSGGAHSLLPASPPGGLSATETVDPVAVYLAVADEFYAAEMALESSGMLDALSEHCEDVLDPVSIAAVRARQGRARFTLSHSGTTEETLRDALARSIRLGARGAASEAMARYYLANLLMKTGRLDEARATALPLLEDPELIDKEAAASLGRTAHLLARITVTIGRRQQQADVRRREFRTAMKLFRDALREAQLTRNEELARLVNLDISDLGELEAPIAGIVEDDEAMAELPAPELPAPAEDPSTEAPSARAASALPPRLLCLFGLVAGTEGALDEAEYWFKRVEHWLRGADADSDDARTVRQELSQARAALLQDTSQ
jgi:tetratricopeptide (TPR) repeat protein